MQWLQNADTCLADWCEVLHCDHFAGKPGTHHFFHHHTAVCRPKAKAKLKQQCQARPAVSYCQAPCQAMSAWQHCAPPMYVLLPTDHTQTLYDYLCWCRNLLTAAFRKKPAQYLPLCMVRRALQQFLSPDCSTACHCVLAIVHSVFTCIAILSSAENTCDDRHSSTQMSHGKFTS